MSWNASVGRRETPAVRSSPREVDVKGSNPYVGAHPFSSTKPIFGRDRELSETVDLLLAERIVLLLSPSGAGKTSLIHACDGIRDRLAKEGFTVHPTVRLQALQAAATVAPGGNRYVAAVQGWLDNTRASASKTATVTEVMTEVEKRSDNTAHVFIFDQFEELLTLNMTDLSAKTDFMRQLGDALKHRHRW